MTKKQLKKRIFNHLSKVGMAIVYLSLFTLPTSSVGKSSLPVDQVVSSEGGKEALNSALKLARSKPAMTAAKTIVCLACVPIGSVATFSPALCVACGILFAKTFG